MQKPLFLSLTYLICTPEWTYLTSEEHGKLHDEVIYCISGIPTVWEKGHIYLEKRSWTIFFFFFLCGNHYYDYMGQFGERLFAD